MVNAQRALFYTWGPAQPTGPDFALPHGQRLKMLSRDFGYSHVAIVGSNQSGYVATEDLAPAPAASPTPAAARTGHARHRSADSRPPTPEEESQIPLPEFPESKPPANAPPFRY